MAKTINRPVRESINTDLARQNFANQGWNDPVSLAAKEECERILANPTDYKRFNSVAELIADCLDGESDDD